MSLKHVVFSTNMDPSAGPGVSAPQGSFLVGADGVAGVLWVKYGTGDTDWAQLGSGTLGPGTTNAVAKFTGANAVGDSQITDDGTAISAVATGTATLGGADVQIAADDDVTILAGGDATLGGTGSVALNTAGSLTATVGGNIALLPTGNMQVSAGGLVSLSTPGDITIESGLGGVTIAAGAGSVDINGLGPIVITAVNGMRLSNDPTHELGFFGTAPIAKPTGVAVTAAAIHAALVSLGLIGA